MKKVQTKWIWIFGLLTIVAAFQGRAQDDIKLIIRGDDLGMTQGSLVAFEKAMNNGMLTCAGVQVPGPWFEAAAELCKKNPGWCVGIHLTVIGEWRGFSWKPVLPWDKVPSIVNEDGYFYRSPNELKAHKPDVKEIEAEFRAQIELALKKGINVQYLDAHYYKMDDYPGAMEVLERLAKDYNLPLSGFNEDKMLAIISVPVDEKKETILNMLNELEPGVNLWVCHPGIESLEQNALIHYEQNDIMYEGGVGQHRAEITDILTGIELKSTILRNGIKLTNYKELFENK